MPKFLISFRVEQLLSGSIEVEAASAEAAREAFERGDVDEQRLAADLDLEDSKDSITEIRLLESRGETQETAA
jgi:hypothetical protein